MDLPSKTKDMLYLCACAVTGKKPDPAKVRSMDLDEIFSTAGKHKVTVLCAMGMASMPEDPEKVLGKEDWSKWQEAIDANIRRRMLFDESRQEIYDFFEKEKIWYLPLKGIHINELYPQYGMREFADNDILIDDSAMEKTREFMLSNGYSPPPKSLGAAHDEYCKDPFLNFEIHHHLFVGVWVQTVADYYENVKERLHRVREDSWEYSFSDEDFYIYFLAHAYEHYRVVAGTGFRAVFDCKVIRDHYKNLSGEYVDKVLKDLELYDFERTLSSVAEKICADPENIYKDSWTEEEERLISFMAGSGAYGTIHNMMENRILNVTREDHITKTSKIKFLLLRIFPRWRYMLIMYPWLKKVPFLLPVMYIWRLIARVFGAPKKIVKEWKLFRKTKAKETL